MSGLVLTRKELHEYTDLRQPAAQARQLREWGVPYKVTTRGRIKVLRADLKTVEVVASPSFEALENA